MITCSMLLTHSTALTPLTYRETHMRAHVHTHLHTHTCTNIATNTYPGTVFICASTPSCLRSRPVSYTLRSMQTSFESIYPSVLSLSLSLPVHLLSPSPLSLPFPLVVTYLVKIPVSRFQTVHIVLSLTFSALGRFKET